MIVERVLFHGHSGPRKMKKSPFKCSWSLLMCTCQKWPQPHSCGVFLFFCSSCWDNPETSNICCINKWFLVRRVGSFNTEDIA